MAVDERGREVSRLMETFYVADSGDAAAIADKILVYIRPLLKKWTLQQILKSNDPMLDAEDFHIEAQMKLLEELRRSRNSAPILDIFGYAKTVVLHLHLMRVRKNRVRTMADSEEAKHAVDPHSLIEDFLAKENFRQNCEEGWKTLAECRVNGRVTLLLALSREEIHAWIGLPDPCPALAAILEMDEASAYALWKQLPLSDQEIAERLNTTVGYIQKLRSMTKAKLRNSIFGEAKG